MTFLNPVWLLLAIPLIVSLLVLRPLSRFLQVIRIIIFSLLLLALAGFCLKLPIRGGTVIVIADRSSSMPPDAENTQKEIIDIIQSAESSSDTLGVVSFGRNSVIEHSPGSGKFPGFVAGIDTDASNLADALTKAISLVPKNSPGRLVIFSDARWTGINPESIISSAASRNIPIDYRLLERPASGDLSVYHIDKPLSVSPGEYFMLNIWIQSPLKQQITYRLSKGSQVVAGSTREISSGLTRLTFRDMAESAGAISYNFNVIAEFEDAVPENNSAEMLVGVAGPKSILCVSDSDSSGLASLLRDSGMNVTLKKAESCDWSLEGLSNYSAVIIEDTPANDIGTQPMQNIAAWVKETGAGLMMTGGKNSFGTGGYFKSPLDPVLPVSMELRKEHRKLALAIVVVLDRSGSMTAPVGGGKNKMDLANLATAQVLDLLTDMDEFGVIAVDSTAHTIVDLAPVSKNAAYRNKILQIDSLGGGIFIYVALSNAAKMISSANAQTKHIILFADAADSEEPGQYIRLLEECQKAGITVSVIGLGSSADQDARLLEDIAKRGQGQIFFTDRPAELPRLFAQDTFVVARSSFLEETVPVKVTPEMYSLAGQMFDVTTSIGGYNMSYLRPSANLAAISLDEYDAPIVASWQAGIGRVLCYTGQADGPFTGDIVNWTDVGSFFTSLAKWTAAQTSELGPDMLLTQQVDSGICTISLHLDPQRQNVPFTELPEVTTLYGLAGQAPQTQSAKMQYDEPDTLILQLPMSGSQTYLSTVKIQNYQPVTLAPVRLPYSPEFIPDVAGRGADVMSRIAKATGGSERINLTNIWKELPKTPRMFYLGKWLLLSAVILVLIEVFERRTGLITGRKWKFVSSDIKWFQLFKPFREKKVKIKKTKIKPEKIKPEKPAAEPAASKPQPSHDLFGALSKAQKRAKRRTDRNQ